MTAFASTQRSFVHYAHAMTTGGRRVLTERFIAAAAITALTTGASIAWLRPLARRIGLLDCPDLRKRHRGRVPLIGGLSFFIGLFAGLVYLGISTQFAAVLLALGAIIMLAGLIDDLRGLSVRARLLVQAAAALLMILASGLYVDDAGNLFGRGVVSIGLLGVPLTVVAVVGLINAFNMLDGIDGLAASQALVTILAIMLFAAGGASESLQVLQLLAVALLPFLLINLGWPDGRRIFMGDAGSTLLGFMIAWCLIELSQRPAVVLAPVDVLWCVAFPVIETLTVMYRRMANGRSPFAADRRHLHHRLLDAGFSSRQVLVLLVLASAALAMAGYGLRALPDIYSLGCFATVLLLHAIWVPRVLRTRPESEVAMPVPARLPVAGIAFAPDLALSMAAPGMPARRRIKRMFPYRQRGAIGVEPTPSQPTPAVQARLAPRALRALCVLEAGPGTAMDGHDPMLPLVDRLSTDARFDAYVYRPGTAATAAESARTEVPQHPVAGVVVGFEAGLTPLLDEIAHVITQFRPDVVVLRGDSTAALLAALVAAYEHVPVVRLESEASAGRPGRCTTIIGRLAARNVSLDEQIGEQLLSGDVAWDRAPATPARGIGAAATATHPIVEALLRMSRMPEHGAPSGIERRTAVRDRRN